jgi:O-antigen/teichoic acid export membrane protein
VFGGYVIQVGISFFSKVAMARILGRAGFGSVSIGVTLVTVLSTITLLGLHTGIGRYLPRFEDGTTRRGVIYSAFGMAVPASLAVGGIMFLSAELIAVEVLGQSELKSPLQVFAVAIPASVVMKLTIGGVRGLQNATAKAVIRSIVYPIVLFGGIAVALFQGLGPTGVAGAYLAAFLSAGAVGCYYLLDGVPSWPTDQSSPVNTDLLRFSAPLMIVGLGAIVFSNTDTLMLGYFETTTEVGIYAVAFTITNLLLTVLASFRFLYMPSASKLDAGEHSDEIRDLYRAVTKWIFFFTFPLFLFMLIFPETVLGLAFGEEYVSGAAVLRVLISGFFIHAIAGPNGASLTSLGETRVVMYDNIVVAVLNVGLNAALIPMLSTLGAAIASAVSYGLLNVLYSYHLYRRTSMRPDIRHHGRVALGVSIPIVILYTSKVVTGNSPVTNLGLMFMFGVVYLLIGTKSVKLQQQEKEIVVQIQRELINRMGIRWLDRRN